MIKGKLSNGFEFAIKKKRLMNMELTEAVANIKEDDDATLIPVINLLLGTEQKKRMYDYIRDEDGIVDKMEVSNMIVEIFSFFQGDLEAKKS